MKLREEYLRGNSWRESNAGRCVQGWSVSEAAARSPEQLYRRLRKRRLSATGMWLLVPPPPALRFICYLDYHSTELAFQNFFFFFLSFLLSFFLSFFFLFSPSIPISLHCQWWCFLSNKLTTVAHHYCGHKICCGTGNVLRGGSVSILGGELMRN